MTTISHITSRWFQSFCEITFFVAIAQSVSVSAKNTSNAETVTGDDLCTGADSDDKPNFMVGSEDFRSLRMYSSAFVDKSQLINEILERGGVVIIVTRPHKWGKTVNMDMFRRFFDLEVDVTGNLLPEDEKKNNALFSGGRVRLGCGGTKVLKGLRISRYKSAMEHHGQNPVLSIGFKNIHGDSYKQFEDMITDRVRQLYDAYPYLSKYFSNNSLPFLGKRYERRDLKEIPLTESLLHLSKLLSKHLDKNIYILIDDYDAPIANAYVKFGASNRDFDKVVELTYTLVGTALKDNWFLERALLSGTYHFGWINEILRLHNLVRHSTIVDATFADFYGFTKVEVEKILSAVGISNQHNLKEWYNGYSLDGNEIYNPWSTLSCLQNNGKYGQYWGTVMESMSELTDKVFLLDEAQEGLHQMLQGKMIMKKDINKPINLIHIGETFHRTLLFGGYLNSMPADCSYNCYIHPWNLSVPNREARELLAQGVAKWVSSKLNLNLTDYNNMTQSFIHLDLEHFRETLQKHLVASNISKTTSELQAKYQLLISGLFTSLATKYAIESFRKSGQKSREYVLTAHPGLGRDAVVVEFEFSKYPKKLQLTVEAGLKRLSNREYIKLKELAHIRRIIKIYLVLTRKKIALKHHVSDVG